MEMARVKIISDPYENKITYMKWDTENGGSWEPITNEGSKLLNEKFTGGVFPFNVKKIVDTIYDEYRIGNDVIFLLFEGTNDEYKELVSVCADEKYGGLIKPKKSLRYLRNARDILHEVTDIFDLMQPLIDDSVKDDSKIAREKHQFKDVTKTDIPICVLGNYSSGKSTFINALIGYEVLPSGDDPLTAKIHRIERSAFDDRASVCFDCMGSRVRIDFEGNGIPEISLSKDTELYTMLYEAVEPYDDRSIACRVSKILEVINSGENSEIMPIQLRIFADRLEITNPGGLYGRLSLDTLGKIQPDTRNPVIATALEVLDVTENRYSGIPTILRECKAHGLPDPEFVNLRGEFTVIFRLQESISSEYDNDKTTQLLEYCKTPRSRKEIADHLGLRLHERLFFKP